MPTGAIVDVFSACGHTVDNDEAGLIIRMDDVPTEGEMSDQDIIASCQFDSAAEVESDVDEEEIPPVKSSDAMNATSTLHQFMEEHPQSFTDEDVLRMLENFKASHQKTAFH